MIKENFLKVLNSAAYFCLIIFTLLRISGLLQQSSNLVLKARNFALPAYGLSFVLLIVFTFFLYKLKFYRKWWPILVALFFIIVFKVVDFVYFQFMLAA